MKEVRHGGRIEIPAITKKFAMESCMKNAKIGKGVGTIPSWNPMGNAGTFSMTMAISNATDAIGILAI